MTSSQHSNADSSVAIAIGIAVIGVFAILFWHGLSEVVFVIPPPLETWRSLRLIAPDLPAAIGATFGATAVSFILAVAFGLICGILIGVKSYWYQTIGPLILVGGSTPKIIIYPILLLIFGLGPKSVIAMGFIGGIFPIMINVMISTRSIKPIYFNVAQVLQTSRWNLLTRICLPAVMGPFVTGVRLCFGLTVVNVIFAELFAAKNGIGKNIMDYYSLGRYAEMMAMISILFIVALFCTILLWLLERYVKRKI